MTDERDWLANQHRLALHVTAALLKAQKPFEYSKAAVGKMWERKRERVSLYRLPTILCRLIDRQIID